MISRCSSPMPAMIVWPVSLSVRTRNDGSSVASFCERRRRASPGRLLVFGSIAMAMTGSGNSIDSRMIGLFVVAERVAGARVAQADRRGDVAGVDLLDLLALVGVHLQEAADALLAARASSCRTYAPDSSVPE